MLGCKSYTIPKFISVTIWHDRAYRKYVFAYCCHQNEVTLLRNEVAQLKQLLLAHKDCPVTIMQKKAAFLGNPHSSTTVLLLIFIIFVSIHPSSPSSNVFFLLAHLSKGECFSLSVCSCRWGGNLSGRSRRSHRLPGSSHPAWSFAPDLCLQPRVHHQRAERPCRRGGGHVGLGWDGIWPAWSDKHGGAVAACPEMIYWCWWSVWTEVAHGGQTCLQWLEKKKKRNATSTVESRISTSYGIVPQSYTYLHPANIRAVFGLRAM